MDELKRRLKEGAQVCQACLQPGDRRAIRRGSVLVAAPPIKDGKIVRGGSTQPLSLNEKPTDLGTSAKDAVSNPDLSHALPGDTLGVGKGEHPVDPAKYTGPDGRRRDLLAGHGRRDRLARRSHPERA